VGLPYAINHIGVRNHAQTVAGATCSIEVVGMLPRLANEDIETSAALYADGSDSKHIELGLPHE
jgi:hypothetical protein